MLALDGVPDSSLALTLDTIAPPKLPRTDERQATHEQSGSRPQQAGHCHCHYRRRHRELRAGNIESELKRENC